MDLSNEDAVTNILSNREILKRQDAPEVFEGKQYSTNPNYDLTLYMKTAKPEPGRFGPRYIFVK